MSKLFIDANFIIAIFKDFDTNHEKAVSNKEILVENDCYISNGVLNEIITIIMMRTKNIELTKKAYRFLNDNFTILNEYDIELFNNKVFSLFKKYNDNIFKLNFIDCSIVIISNHYNLDGVVSFDKNFNLFQDINLIDFKGNNS